ncbi:ACT domain-containing protein [Kiritimatiellota bacterium B12222]|nr:ACT domain-containing protein [Kiritimatiellota bacterium B12222]
MNLIVVMTVLGPDRPGIVESLAELIQQHQGSWLESRLAQLQDQFAGIIEFSLPASEQAAFESSLEVLKTSFQLQCQWSQVANHPSQSTRSVHLECLGQDRPGIVLAITDVLHDLNINVESMDTSLENAPMSGEILFKAGFEVGLPAQIDLNVLESRLSRIGEELMLDVQIED